MASSCPCLPPSPATLAQAVEVLKSGGVVAYPTETYYGLAVDPSNEAAVARLFAVKGRRENKPVLLLIDVQQQVERYAAQVPPPFVPLMEEFWPGPLTLVFPAAPQVLAGLQGGTGTVGLRLSPHPVARALCDAWGGPLTATSANRSGASPAATAAEVTEQFDESLDLIIDGGMTSGVNGSTVVGEDQGSLRLLRPGLIPFSQLQTCVAAAGVAG